MPVGATVIVFDGEGWAWYFDPSGEMVGMGYWPYTTETKGQHFTRARNNQTDVYMLGWATLPMLDTYSVLSSILHSPQERFGSWNPGGYANARIDEITDQIGTMIDEPQRRALMQEALRIAKDEMAAVPLHQQPLSWAVRDGVELVQSPDDKIRLWYARKN